MALKLANQTKLITASGGGTLVADAGESFLVKDIFCLPSSNDGYLTLLTQGTTVAKLRVKGLAGNHLSYPHIKTSAITEGCLGTVLSWLRLMGLLRLGKVPTPFGGGLEEFKANALDIRFPVASGQTLTVSRYAETGQVVLLYDVYDEKDITPDLPNGTQCRVNRYLHYITNVASAANGACAVTTSLIWTGGDGWPVNAQGVPENTKYRLGAIVGNPLAKGASAASKGYTTHLQLIRENTVLFDEDRSGLPFKGDTSALSAVGYVSEGSVIGPVTAENPRPGLVIDPALEFGPGEKLSVNIIIAGYASGGPGAGELDLALALERQYG